MEKIKREDYLSILRNFKDQQIIKVITGIRRCGKSTLLELFQDYLKENGVEEKQIVSINFEDADYEELQDRKKLYEYLKSKLIKDKKTYIFLDEIQKVNEFEKTVDSLFINKDVDLYITGSNAWLLSSELATLLTGRYIEIKMLPLSFKEFLKFANFESNISIDEKFNQYMKYGGMPGIIKLNYDYNLFDDAIKGIYNTVFMKDVIEKNKLIDASLLEKVLKFLMSNTGSLISSKKIADFLTSQGTKVTHNTILNYLKMLENAYIIYKAPRYDIKGKELLKTLEKYYIVDIGIRNSILGFRNSDYGHIIENIVFFELLNRGYTVTLGKNDSLEVDFIATNSKEKKYYQVTLSLLEENVRNREFAPLKNIHDNYEKTILTLDRVYNETFEEGIKCKNIIDFLLEKE